MSRSMSCYWYNERQENWWEKKKRTPSFLLDEVRPNEHQKEEEDRI